MVVLGAEKEKSFEFLEHTADVYVAAHGTTLEEAFENSASAMFETMTETDKVSPAKEDRVEVEAEDEYALLYSWLEALLVKSELEGMLYSKFKIQKIVEKGENFKLNASVWGEKFNAEKHPQKVAVKAITYHQMEIIKEINNVTVMFILDI
jgi:SHS2 domain-containing protein